MMAKEWKFDMEPLFAITKGKKIRVHLYRIKPKQYTLKVSHQGLLSLNAIQFTEILSGFIASIKPSKRQPFWHGLVSWDENKLIEAYACNERYIKLIASTCGVLGPEVPHYCAQMLLDAHLLKEMCKIISEDKPEVEEKPTPPPMWQLTYRKDNG